jgi:hypothetical protein
MKPQRIQRQRTKGWRMPENTVYVGRGTLFGNPYKVGHWNLLTLAPVKNAAEAVQLFRENCDWLAGTREDEPSVYVEPLRGKNLACWCPLGAPCHADVLLEWANE